MKIEKNNWLECVFPVPFLKLGQQVRVASSISKLSTFTVEVGAGQYLQVSKDLSSNFKILDKKI